MTLLVARMVGNAPAPIDPDGEHGEAPWSR